MIDSISGVGDTFSVQKVDSMERIIESIREVSQSDAERQADRYDMSRSVYKQFVSEMNDKLVGLRSETSDVELAQGAVEEIKSGLNRMEEIVTDLNSGVLDEERRSELTEELAAQAAGIDKLVDETSVGDRKLLDGGEEALADLTTMKGLSLTGDAAGNIKRAMDDAELAQDSLDSREERLHKDIAQTTDTLERYQE
ncbi:MAG: hypothetical protein ACLFV7_12180, partial [Phycisphaerae bacterium]